MIFGQEQVYQQPDRKRYQYHVHTHLKIIPIQIQKSKVRSVILLARRKFRIELKVRFQLDQLTFEAMQGVFQMDL